VDVRLLGERRRRALRSVAPLSFHLAARVATVVVIPRPRLYYNTDNTIDYKGAGYSHQASGVIHLEPFAG